MKEECERARAPKPKDSQLIDMLERFVLDGGWPLILWTGDGQYPGSGNSVGLAFGGKTTKRRSLRKALRQLACSVNIDKKVTR